MAQTRDHLGLSGSLGKDLRWGGKYAVHPIHYASGGLLIGTTAYLLSPAVVPAVQFGSMAATGLVPGGTEVIIFLNRLKVLRLSSVQIAGAAAATGVGVWNAYRLRNEISSFAKEKYDWIINKANWTPDMEFGTLRSHQRDGPAILSQRTSKSPSAGTRRRRCKSRNKSGKTCLRPRNHSGRHRFQ